MLKKWLREPLLHFLLIGAALFVLYGLQNDAAVGDSSRIVFTEADIDRLIALWNKKWQRLPTQQELEGLIESQLREEVLYREALSKGMDREDPRVRMALIQKMEMMAAGKGLRIFLISKSRKGTIRPPICTIQNMTES